MSEFETTNPKNHFPVVAQLFVLVLILGAVFSTLFLQAFSDGSVAVEETIGTPAGEPRMQAAVPLSITNVSLQADAAYVWDVQGQRALYSDNAGAALPLASITKLMTTLLAYELVTEDTPAAIPLSAIRQEGSSGLIVGEILSLEKLSQMALISSSNDAAYTLGASVGALLGNKEPESQFVTAMNIRAKELGLESMVFYNTTGLDLSTTQAGAFGSARDVSFLMEHIIENYPELIMPTTQSAALVYNETGEYHEVENTNDIVNQIPNLMGSKTGFTDLAGGNLVVAFDAGLDRPIIITVLGSTRDARFADVLTLVAATQAAISNI